MAGRGQVSWLPGIGLPHLPEGSVSPPVAGAKARPRLSHPVTVAGPRRFLTGLPLTTDRMYVASLSAETSHDRHVVRLGDSKVSRPTVVETGSSPLSAMRRLASSCSSKRE
jgi:hypothetical protein